MTEVLRTKLLHRLVVKVEARLELKDGVGCGGKKIGEENKMVRL